jgi:peptide deformylase
MVQICQLGHAVLRNAAARLRPDELKSAVTSALIGELRAALLEHGGVGCAAPQIGVSVAAAIVEDRAIPRAKSLYAPEHFERLERTPLPAMVLLNPRILEYSSEQAFAFETCLSIPELVGVVPRARGVRVQFSDEQGQLHDLTFTGFPARIIQHEIDHLNGCLCIDRMLLRTAMTKDHFYATGWRERTAEDALEQYGATPPGRHSAPPSKPSGRPWGAARRPPSRPA